MKIPLKTDSGRTVANLDTETGEIYKQVYAKTHMLQKPRAWAYDMSIYNELMGYAIDKKIPRGKMHFTVNARDEGKTYTISFDKFNEHLFEFNRGHGNQVAVTLDRWAVEKDGIKQLELFA